MNLFFYLPLTLIPLYGWGYFVSQQQRHTKESVAHMSALLIRGGIVCSIMFLALQLTRTHGAYIEMGVGLGLLVIFSLIFFRKIRRFFSFILAGIITCTGGLFSEVFLHAGKEEIGKGLLVGPKRMISSWTMAVCIGFGFAIIENTLYLWIHGQGQYIELLTGRILFSLPIHIGCSFLFLLRLSGGNSIFKLGTILSSIFIHFLFNWFVISNNMIGVVGVALLLYLFLGWAYSERKL